MGRRKCEKSQFVTESRYPLHVISAIGAAAGCFCRVTVYGLWEQIRAAAVCRDLSNRRSRKRRSSPARRATTKNAGTNQLSGQGHTATPPLPILFSPQAHTTSPPAFFPSTPPAARVERCRRLFHAPGGIQLAKCRRSRKNLTLIMEMVFDWRLRVCVVARVMGDEYGLLISWGGSSSAGTTLDYSGWRTVNPTCISISMRNVAYSVHVTQ